MWHVDAEIISLLFMLTIMVDVFRNGTTIFIKDKLFKVLAVTTVFAILFDIISSYAMNQYQSVSWWLIEGSLIIYFILMPMLSMLWCLYVIAVISNSSKIKRTSALFTLIPFAIYTVIVCSNPVTEWIFGLSASNEYTRGILFDAIFFVFYGYSVAILVLAFLNFKKTERATSVVLIVFPIIAGLGVFLQQILSSYLITGAAFTLVLLITYMFLQNRKATRDNLTGLYNRLAFSMSIERLTKSTEQGAVLAVAVDDFKLFNQTFGQKKGDMLLKKIADYLVEISPNKTCYRYGGDIFTIILRKLDEQETFKIADRIMEEFASPFYMGDVGYSVSVSIGIVEYPNKSDGVTRSIITALDFAIYQAKKRGKGQTAFFNEDLICQFKHKYDLMEVITKAIKNNSFMVYIQPIYHGEQKKFIFAEALLRLKDEKHGWISPAEFIPIVEETGQIVELTYFVLEEVCSFIKKNRDAFHEEVSVSVNFSVIQFMQSDMVERIRGIIESYDIPPSLIKIEITESVIAESFDDIKAAMVQLNDYGIRFALDDYGQGYSNISYLINLPFTFVKLDKSIIDHMITDRKFICALVPMFKKLDKILIAEGVETKEQLDILNELSCDAIQGFYFAKPSPMGEAAKLLCSSYSASSSQSI